MSENIALTHIKNLKDVFDIAADGFDTFFSEAKEKSLGNYSTAASSGDFSTAASSGYRSTAASSGDDSAASSSGDFSIAASSGYYSKASSSGYRSTAASSGYRSTAASSGEHSAAASLGYYSTAASSGAYSTAVGVGYRAMVSGDLGNLIMATEYNSQNIPIGGKADIIDGKRLKAGAFYIVENGQWVEVDFTDDIFSYVISAKKGIKKVKLADKNEKILFVVKDDQGNAAHGETIKEAQEALIYKTTVNFDGKVPGEI